MENEITPILRTPEGEWIHRGEKAWFEWMAGVEDKGGGVMGLSAIALGKMREYVQGTMQLSW